MYKCSHCHYRSDSPKSYSQHYAIHKYVNKTSFPCGVPGCTREFRVYESFTSHLSRDHSKVKTLRSGTEKTSDASSSTTPGHQPGQVGGPQGLLEVEVDLTCSHCEMTCSQYSVLLAHLKQHIKNGVVVTCPFKGCISQYRVISSLTSHLSRIHQVLQQSNSENGSCAMSPSVECGVVGDNIGADENLQNMDNQQQPLPAVEEHENFDDDLSDDVFLESVALFYLQLESKHHVPQSTLQKIITGICDFHDRSQEQVQIQLKKILEEEGITPDRIPLIVNEVFSNDLFHLVNNSHDGTLRSNYCRKKFYKSNLNYIEHVQIRLGRDGKNFERHYQYVPIRETIESFFQDTSVQKQYDMKPTSASGIYEDVHSGVVFKNHELFGTNPHAVPILLYQDAFEVVNPLGSAKNKHKILAVYATFGNLLPQNRSKIEPLQLVLLCREKDFKYFGMDVVFWKAGD
ncbi:uncharacterized protein LOC135495545 [Lineus longissimus]|uniref:uncharacterized protein LOC135495545 n=1 Tax=Lineus longissimus TaxID=88925 RepID=UPI00315C6A58